MKSLTRGPGGSGKRTGRFGVVRVGHRGMPAVKLLSFAVALLSAVSAFGDWYSVTVTRMDQDLYKVGEQSPPVYVVTEGCYEYVYYDEAVLRYDEYSYDNKLQQRHLVRRRPGHRGKQLMKRGPIILPQNQRRAQQPRRGFLEELKDGTFVQHSAGCLPLAEVLDPDGTTKPLHGRGGAASDHACGDKTQGLPS